MSTARLDPSFLDTIPDRLDDGVLYVSIEFRTTMHLCACGCGNPVVLPLRPSGWSLTYDGESVSMRPSVGNWSFPCQSHYWIRGGNVEWAPKWGRAQIEAGRRRTLDERAADSNVAAPPADESRTSWWRDVLAAGCATLRRARSRASRPDR